MPVPRADGKVTGPSDEQLTKEGQAPRRSAPTGASSMTFSPSTTASPTVW